MKDSDDNDRCPAWEDGEHHYDVSHNIEPRFKLCACGRSVRAVREGWSYVDKPFKAAR